MNPASRETGISRWMGWLESASKPGMKSCLGMLLILSVFILVVGGGAVIWHLSSSAEFSRKDKVPPPRAAPVSGIRR